jgi:hypothetical protein
MQQGIFRSSDAGHTWQSINNGLTVLSMGRAAPVIIDPTNRQTLYVGSEGGGVFKSLDRGGHWFAVNSGLSDLTVLGLAMDPANPAVLYACGPSGVFKTLTGGISPLWQAMGMRGSSGDGIRSQGNAGLSDHRWKMTLPDSGSRRSYATRRSSKWNETASAFGALQSPDQ